MTQDEIRKKKYEEGGTGGRGTGGQVTVPRLNAA